MLTTSLAPEARSLTTKAAAAPHTSDSTTKPAMTTRSFLGVSIAPSRRPGTRQPAATMPGLGRISNNRHYLPRSRARDRPALTACRSVPLDQPGGIRAQPDCPARHTGLAWDVHG